MLGKGGSSWEGYGIATLFQAEEPRSLTIVSLSVFEFERQQEFEGGKRSHGVVRNREENPHERVVLVAALNPEAWHW